MTDGKMKDNPRAEVIKLLNLVADIRDAVGDPEGKLMQSELVERCRELRVKAEPPEPLPLHEQLKAARETKGLSLRKLGEMTGLCFSNICQFENGKGGRIGLNGINRICDALEINLYVK